ncbi:MAG: hypothetical protein K2O69_07240 [Odoribacter sp.]|nr:hypothetical protein [Odoribacter sp.]
MKAEKLTELIHCPDRIGSEELQELASLIERYPYFQTARILYLKALHLHAGLRFRYTLKDSTIHITNHKQLFRYLNDQVAFNPIDRTIPSSPLTDIVEERFRELYGHTEVTSMGIPAYAPAPPKEEEIAQFNLPSAPPKPTPGTPPSPASIPPEHKRYLPPEPTGNVISNPITLDDIPGIVSGYSDYDITPMPAPEPQEYKHPQVSVPVGEEPALIRNQIDFSGIPGMIDDLETGTSAPATPITLDVEQDMTDLAPKQEVPHTSPTPLQPKTQKEELIDRFIRNEPAMPRADANTKKEIRDLSKENPYTSEELFSETLAKIYVKQGLYERAIQTYIKLSLKYPEKSVYFANRIENIKENINHE